MTEIKTETVKTAGRPRTYDDNTVKEMLALLESGKTQREVAEKFGMSVQTVQYWKRKMSGSTPARTNALNTDEHKLIAGYDSKIAKLGAVVEAATNELRELTAKRKRLAKAVGLVDADSGTQENGSTEETNTEHTTVIEASE